MNHAAGVMDPAVFNSLLAFAGIVATIVGIVIGITKLRRDRIRRDYGDDDAR